MWLHHELLARTLRDVFSQAMATPVMTDHQTPERQIAIVTMIANAAINSVAAVNRPSATVW